MATTDPAEFTLYASNLTTKLAILPVVQGHIYFEINEPGSGDIRIPLDSSAAALISSGMFIQIHYRGSARGGFYVDNLKEVEVDSSEGAGRWLSVSGRGPLALLDQEIIWSDGTSETTRIYTGVTKASILKDLIDEAQGRGGLANLSYDFTDTDDSDSVAWTDSEEYRLPVGTSLLDVARQFSRTGGFDFEINLVAGVFVLSAYSAGIGTDNSDSVYFRAGVNCEEIGRDVRGDEVVNVYLVKYKHGYITVEDSASITAYGRREELLSLEQAQSAASAVTYAAAKLAITKDPKTGKTVKIYDGIAPFLFLDYNMGDNITLDIFGSETSDRILGIQADFNGADFSHVVIELNTIMYDNEMRLTNDLNWLENQWNTAHDGNLTETTFWSIFGYGATINSMIVSGGYIYVVGEAVALRGVASPGIARYHIESGTWSSVGAGFDDEEGTVIIEYDGNIYAFTFHDVLGSEVAERYKWDGSTLSYLGGTGIGERVNGAAVHDGILFLGHNVYPFVINFDGATWNSYFWGFDAGIASCRALVDFNGDVYAGFEGAAIGSDCFQVGFVDQTVPTLGYGWTPVPLSNMTSFDVQALAVLGTSLAIANNEVVMLWDGVSSAAVNIGTLSGGTARVRAMVTNLNDLYITGDFTTINGVSGFANIAKYSGGVWSKLTTGLVGDGRTLAFDDNDLYVGGNISQAGDKAADGLAVYLTDFQSILDHLDNAGNDFDMAAAIHNAATSAITDADEMGFWEDVSQGLRKITWSNIKSTLQTFFNTVYFRLDATNGPITGSVDIAAGETYNIDGTPHTHAGGSGHSIEDEGTPLAARSKLNFVGAGVTVTDDSGDDASVVTIPGGAVVSNANDIFRCNSCAASLFTGTINGTPSGASVVYTPVSGNENVLVPASTSQLGKMRLYNTTRGNSALISNCNTGTNTITLTANAPGDWASGDALTTQSPTVSGGGFSWIDIEITSGDFVGKSFVFLYLAMIDSGGAGQALIPHPFETFAAGKLIATVQTQTTQVAINTHPYKLTSNIITVAWTASGATSATVIIRQSSYLY